MKRLLIQFSFFVFIGALFSSCIEDIEKERVFDDVAMVEFNQTTTNVNFNRLTNTGAGIITERVNLVAPHFATDQTLNFTVDASQTTAEAGVHYSLVNDGVFVISANSSFGDASVQILGTAIPTGTTRVLVLELVGNEMITPSENYKKVRITIRP
jgi:hypothetical protein